MTETLSKDLAAIVERWRGIARKAAQENADVNSRLQRGETVTITTNIGPCKDLRDQCADELSALLAQHAVAPNEQIFSGAELGDSVKRVAPVADGSSPSKAPSNTAAHMAESSKLTALESQAQSILTNCCQLLDSIKSEWAPENCWSDWDQSIRDAASTWLKDSYAQHAIPEPQTLGQRMGTGAPAVLLQKIEAILGRCVFDQPDSLTYDEGVKLVRELVAPAHAAEQPKLTESKGICDYCHKPVIVRMGARFSEAWHAKGDKVWHEVCSYQQEIERLKELLAAPVAPPPPYPASAQSPKQIGDKILISDKEKCWLAQVISRLDDLAQPPLAPGEQPPKGGK